LLIQAFGSLRISQLVMPLGFILDKFGNNSLGDIIKADIAALKIGGQSLNLSEAQESFAPSLFKKMSDDDKLKSPSFTKNKGGITITDDGAIEADLGWNREVSYEVKVSDFDPFPAEQPAFPIHLDLFKRMTRGGAVAKAALSKELKAERTMLKNGRVKMADEDFVVINHEDLTAVNLGAFTGGTKARAEDQLKLYIKANPSMKGKVSVVPAYELID